MRSPATPPRAHRPAAATASSGCAAPAGSIPRHEITPERERRGTISAMHFRSLRWLTVAVPLLFLALVDVLRHQVWPELLHPWPGFLVVLGIVAGATWLFSE